ncbi:MAG: replication initiation protein [Nitrospirae bacterium]|nr:replication initiation protein [Nitrospirota bacterium]
MAKKNLKQLVVQANHIVEAHYRLSLNEQKIIRAMISRIKPDDEDFQPISFSVEELTEMIGVSGDYHTEIRKVTEGLLVRTLHIHNPKEKSYLSVNWISSYKFLQILLRQGIRRVRVFAEPKAVSDTTQRAIHSLSITKRHAAKQLIFNSDI